MLTTLPGTPVAASIVDQSNDASLSSLSPQQMFASLFRMAPGTYRMQPAAVRLEDCAVNCSAKLIEAVQANPGSMLWVDGDMTIDSNVTLGSALKPVLIVASGSIRFDAASVRIYGLVYSQARLGQRRSQRRENRWRSRDGRQLHRQWHAKDRVRPRHPRQSATGDRFVRTHSGQLEGFPMTRIVQGSPSRASSPSQRGVSLVEAIVAMAVMAFGMMALVGLQTTLRLNADVAKQRSEAVRIGEAAIENWRAFSTMPITAGVKAYGDIALGVLADEAVAGSNATYTLKRTVEPRVRATSRCVSRWPGPIAPATRRASC